MDDPLSPSSTLIVMQEVEERECSGVPLELCRTGMYWIKHCSLKSVIIGIKAISSKISLLCLLHISVVEPQRVSAFDSSLLGLAH